MMVADTTTQSVFTGIQSLSTPSGQLVALRALKNDLVGNQLKKESWMRAGIIDPLVKLSLPPESQGVRPSKAKSSPAPEELSENEAIRLQALCVMGSLAYGGPAFVTPLHSASAIPAFLANICPSSNPPQIVTTALQSLDSLTNSISAAFDQSQQTTNAIADLLFTKPHVGALNRILSQSSSSVEIRTQISLVTRLVSKLCREERHQIGLANAGITACLAQRLAEVVMAQGMVPPSADIYLHGNHGLRAASDSISLAGILESIAIVIADSKFRASQLVYSDAILAVFSATDYHQPPAEQSSEAAWRAFSASDLSTRQRMLNAVELLVPQVPQKHSRYPAGLVTFPPLGTSSSSDNLHQITRQSLGSPAVRSTDHLRSIETWPQSSNLSSGATTPEQTSVVEEPESRLISYLIWLAKMTTGVERLMSIFVLAVLWRTGLVSKAREPLIGYVIIPMLVQLIELGNTEVPKSLDISVKSEMTAARWLIQERAPAVLAMLIVDSEYLQKTAFDAKVVVKLSKMIKVAYDPVRDEEPGLWSADGHTDSSSEGLGTNSAIDPFLLHKIKVRESTLGAIAALVPFKDEYRKAIISQGVVPYIVESLRPLPNKPVARSIENSDKSANKASGPTTQSPGYGTNPVSVLIAACGAVRYLSRSVSVLRTTLIDNGVAMPIFELLRHPEVDVQIAATAVVTNLVMDFSPMRETISEAGVLKVLCEHAHSGNVKLRLNALWALKHLVVHADNEVKKTCLEELGQGWLLQLICADTEDDAISALQSSVASTYGDMFRDSMQVDQDSEDEGSRMVDSIGALGQIDQTTETIEEPGITRSIGRPGTYVQMSSRLELLRDLETNPVRRARKDDVEVQEQGLEFIRNLIGHSTASVGSSETSEMVDFLFNALGQDQMLDILAAKLRPRAPSTDNLRGTSVMPHAEIITAVAYILVHIAASEPRHRQLLMSQTELLKLVVPHFNHSSREVRVALCWLVINLTWMDNSPDGPACAQRAKELKNLGFLSSLEGLATDKDLDVRERAKTAVYQMTQRGC